MPVFEQIRMGELQVGQLLIEVHLNVLSAPTPAHEYQAQVVRYFMAAASAGLRLFSKERNGWGCDGYLCVEFSFLDVRHACKAFLATHCPDSKPAEVCKLEDWTLPVPLRPASSSGPRIRKIKRSASRDH